MDWHIKPVTGLHGEVTVPADKSITHRAVMIAALAEGESVIGNYLPADDCMRTVSAFESLGVTVKKTDTVLRVFGAGLRGLKAPSGAIDAGNSGTTVRLMSGILAGQDFSTKITGDESLMRRPMKRIIVPLERMGAAITARDGNFLPLEIKGKSRIKPIRYLSPVASAQVKSSILFAGLYAEGTTVVEEPLKSRDHTERMLLAAGADIRTEGCAVSLKGPARLAPQRITVPGDVSSAAFFLVAGSIVPGAALTLLNVGVNPTRDGIIEVLEKMNADLRFLRRFDVSGEPAADIEVRNAKLGAVEVTRELMPRLIDEVPALVLAATQASGTTVISGAGELRVKESDRLKTVSSELGRMGADITETEDGLIIRGPVKLRGAEVESHGDHRVAMTLAVAGLIAEGETVIRNVDCVSTSFPGFMSTLSGVSA